MSDRYRGGDFMQRIIRESIPLYVFLSVFGVGWLLWHAVERRYDIAIKRIKLEEEQAKEAQITERLRIEKLSGWGASQPVPGVARPVMDGATGLRLLRDMVAAEPSIPVSKADDKGKRSTSFIRGMVDALASSGAIAANEAKSIKDDLQKAGLEIGVDAAKALISKYIKGQEKSSGYVGGKNDQSLYGAAQVTLYCNTPSVRVAPPPVTHPKPKPKQTCP